jgi:hypothetical protein
LPRRLEPRREHHDHPADRDRRVRDVERRKPAEVDEVDDEDDENARLLDELLIHRLLDELEEDEE